MGWGGVGWGGVGGWICVSVCECWGRSGNASFHEDGVEFFAFDLKASINKPFWWDLRDR